jgi:hypothetical protein
LKRSILLALLLATPAVAQDASLVENFAQGFTFHSIFADSRKVDADGAVVYSGSRDGNTHIASVRPGAVPCVFISTSLNLNEGSNGTLVMLEETYDLRGVSFEADARHQFAPPDGVYLTMKGPKILCRVSTGGTGGKLQRGTQCSDRLEATIEPRMMPAFTRATAELKSLCKWR